MPTLSVTRKVSFSASHRLNEPKLSAEDNRRIYGRCNGLNGHGHNYTLELTLRGKLDASTGMVMNLDELEKVIARVVLDKMDHKHLNLDVEEFKSLNPTAENVAVVIWKLLERQLPAGLLSEVKLMENDSNWVTYRGE